MWNWITMYADQYCAIRKCSTYQRFPPDMLMFIHSYSDSDFRFRFRRPPPHWIFLEICTTNCGNSMEATMVQCHYWNPIKLIKAVIRIKPQGIMTCQSWFYPSFRTFRWNNDFRGNRQCSIRGIRGNHINLEHLVYALLKAFLPKLTLKIQITCFILLSSAASCVRFRIILMRHSHIYYVVN